MSVLNIRDIGAERKAALEAEAKAAGVSMAELVRRHLDQGIGKAQAERARERWIAEAREDLD